MSFNAAGGFSRIISKGQYGKRFVSHLQNIPVLAYHSHRIAGTTYATNDHISLVHDLRTIHEHGYRIIPLRWVAAWAVGQRQRDVPAKAVGISLDGRGEQ